MNVKLNEWQICLMLNILVSIVFFILVWMECFGEFKYSICIGFDLLKGVETIEIRLIEMQFSSSSSLKSRIFGGDTKNKLKCTFDSAWITHQSRVHSALNPIRIDLNNYREIWTEAVESHRKVCTTPSWVVCLSHRRLSCLSHINFPSIE